MEGKSVFTCIEDNGQRIEPEMLIQVFDPTYSGESKINGTGLGLAYCKKVIEE